MAEFRGKSDEKAVRVRFAPSPTGPIHIGSVRTALFNWLFARHHGGVFLLRIEDTDKERSEKKYEDQLLEGLAWVGLQWDEGPFRQSERTEIYKKYLLQLIDRGDAYYCYCSKEELEADRQAATAAGSPPKYNGRCRTLTKPPAGKKPEVIRFKLPEIKVEFNDLVRGTVVFDAALFGDIVIAKDLDSPLYNFVVVIDDALMDITHVIRGEEHLSNTPKQLLLIRALGFHEPIYAHIPLILNSDRTKMSKRFADTALMNYRDRGYLPEAMVNFLALMGWHPKGDKEILSREEMVSQFDIGRVQQAGAIFNEEKLDWLNREHMRMMPPTELAELALPFFEKRNISVPDAKLLERVAASQSARAKTLDEIASTAAFFFALPDYDASLLIWKDKMDMTEVKNVLEHSRAVLDLVPTEQFAKPHLSELLPALVGEKSRGVVLWPLRVALSGQAASPDPVEIMDILGKEESLRRIEGAIKKAQ